MFLSVSCWQVLLALNIDYAYYLLDFVNHFTGVDLIKFIPGYGLVILNFLLIKSFFSIIFDYAWKALDKYFNK